VEFEFAVCVAKRGPTGHDRQNMDLRATHAAVEGQITCLPNPARRRGSDKETLAEGVLAYHIDDRIGRVIIKGMPDGKRFGIAIVAGEVVVIEPVAPRI
jgi:hypothetical protein